LSHSRTDGLAATNVSASKDRKYGAVARRLGLDFHPLIYETYGRSAATTDAFLIIMAKAFASRHRTADISLDNLISLVVHQWRVKLSCTLQRCNARLITRKVHAAHSSRARGSIPHRVDIADLLGSIC
jgi:hypothetical protein